jgi:hypothetical protein
MTEVQEHPSLNMKMLHDGPPLGGDHVGDALMLVQLGRVENNSYVGVVDGRPP